MTDQVGQALLHRALDETRAQLDVAPKPFGEHLVDVRHREVGDHGRRQRERQHEPKND